MMIIIIDLTYPYIIIQTSHFFQFQLYKISHREKIFLAKIFKKLNRRIEIRLSIIVMKSSTTNVSFEKI